MPTRARQKFLGLITVVSLALIACGDGGTSSNDEGGAPAGPGTEPGTTAPTPMPTPTPAPTPTGGAPAFACSLPAMSVHFVEQSGTCGAIPDGRLPQLLGSISDQITMQMADFDLCASWAGIAVSHAIETSGDRCRYTANVKTCGLLPLARSLAKPQTYTIEVTQTSATVTGTATLHIVAPSPCSSTYSVTTARL